MIRKFKAYRTLLILFTTIFLLNPIFPQSMETLHEFYQNEISNTLQKFTYTNNSVDNYDVNFYHIDIDIDIDNKFIAGSVLCRFTSTQGNTNQIELDLDQVFTVDSISGSSSHQHSNNKLIVNLPHPLNQQETSEITIYYRGFPRLANNTKGLRFETHGDGYPVVASLSTPYLAHLWWPCKDGPSDKTDSVYIDITIPDVEYGNLPLIAVSNGVLENTEVKDGKKTFFWRERYPIVPYYVMTAVSNYKVLFQNYNGTTSPNFPIYYYVFEENESSARSVFAPFEETIDLFHQHFGPYPFREEKYAMTELGFYGGIENQTNTIINSINMSWLYVVVHEYAHMWFGDMITCNSWNDAWLNEGFATYSEALFAENTGGVAAYKNRIKLYEYFGNGSIHLNKIDNPFQIFIRIIYHKGAYVLHMLRGVMGDENFFNALKSYSSQNELMYKHATTSDFQEICENYYLSDLSFFFDQWIYNEYYPSYEHYLSYEGRDDYSLNISQTQSDSGRRPVFEMPVQIKLYFEDNTDTLITVWNDNQDQTFLLNFSKEIIDYEFDPNEWILKKSNKLFDKIVTNIPAAFTLFQNYPNPFNPATTIEFFMPQKGFAKLIISDILGRTVQTILEKDLEPGKYEVEFNPINLSSGVYFYTLVADNLFETKKMLLLR